MSARGKDKSRRPHISSLSSAKQALILSSQQEDELSDAGDSSVAELAFSEFESVGIKAFLDHDPRPTFIISLVTDSDGDLGADLAFLFSNAALRSNHPLSQALSSSVGHNFPETSTTDFGAWLKDISHLKDLDHLDPASFAFWGFTWTGFSLHKRWLVVSGSIGERTSISGAFPIRNGSSPSSETQSSTISKEKVSRGKSAENQASRAPPTLYASPPSIPSIGVSPDWTLPQPEAGLSPHVMLARSIDWGSTPLGDLGTWSPEFRQLACLLMASPFPTAIFWGEELTMLYNDAYAKRVAGIKHPAIMGTGFRGPFAEVWDAVAPVFSECRRTGNSIAVDNQFLSLNRTGFEEETYYSWSLTPLYGGTDTVQGFYNTPVETTRTKIYERRTTTLIRLAESVALAQNVSNFWVLVLRVLEANEFDFPFALLYSLADDVESASDEASMSSESSQSMKTCVLEGSLGVPEGHPAAPTRLDLKRSRGGFIPSFREAMTTREPRLLNIADGTLSESLMEGFQWRGFPEPCRLAIVCPIRPTTGENVIGFLVIGINQRRVYDDDYKAFVSLLNRQLATALASVTLFEEEIRRGQTTEVERSRLSEELAAQKSRLQRVAEASPVGMFSLSSSGVLLEANDRFFHLTGHRRDNLTEMSWIEVWKDSSRSKIEAAWAQLTNDGIGWSGELQPKKVWLDPSTGEPSENWILADCSVEHDSEGNITTIMGSITDITLQKRSARDAEARAHLSEQLLIRTKEAEALQNQRLKEAEETRRQQNNFIDITSHEMRNPLSAIVQCADSILTSMVDLRESKHLDPDLVSMVKDNIDYAETIQLCAGHQKNIVNDILTISKLDSNLLLITPVPIRPVKVTEQCLKMVKTEVQIAGIDLNFQLDSSFQEIGVDSVLLDPSRISQVLINLLTNAIKFTKSESNRKIYMTLSAHLQTPSEKNSDFQYFPTKKVRSDFIDEPDWGNGEILYLRWEVKDSGCGITSDEKKNLFSRFSQASPRTHVQYGGSGLGLFISRQLAELQGGEIGVASEAGVGSTFAFYLKCRRTEKESSEATSRSLNVDLESKISKELKDHGKALSQLLHYSAPSPSLVTPGTVASHSDPKLWHVLIVEDNLVNQRILAAQIRKLGCTVHVANHGEEALSMLRETKHYKGREADGSDLSVVLMDLEMPIMDGLTCVRRIREMEINGEFNVRLPVIAVTANARGEQVAAARNSGMDDVMPKPFRIKELVPKIEALLKTHNLS